jgi:CRP-like cAMP-binding protein
MQSPVVRRCGALQPITDHQTRDLENHLIRAKQRPRGTMLLQNEKSPLFLSSGWACRQHITTHGRRNIFSFLIPGDVLRPSVGIGDEPFISTVALTDVTTVTVPLEYMYVVENSQCEDVASLYNQITRLGAMNSLVRTAHLLLELYHRLVEVGLASNWRFNLSINREALGDALGMSTVHANRTFQELRRVGLIASTRDEIRILNPARMRAVANND